MGAFQILDLIIGMAFVYFLLSLICVALQEIKARKYNERSENLRKWVYDTFKKGKENNELAEKLWNNIIIDGLTQEGKAASYIPKDVFVSALFDEIHYDSNDKKERKESGNDDNASSKEPYDFNSIRESIETSTLLPNRIKRVLRQIHSESYGNLESFKDRLEKWFENAMDRNAGTFKKQAQKWVLVFSICVTVFLNVDSVKLIDYFYRNPAEAARIADAAEKMLKDKVVVSDTSKTTKKLLEDVKLGINELKGLKLPIGWRKENLKRSFCNSNPWTNAGNVLMTLLGWFITAIAVSLGAPFWYDTLNKLVDLRSAGKKPSATLPAGSGDPGKTTTDNPIG